MKNEMCMNMNAPLKEGGGRQCPLLSTPWMGTYGACTCNKEKGHQFSYVSSRFLLLAPPSLNDATTFRSGFLEAWGGGRLLKLTSPPFLCTHHRIKLHRFYNNFFTRQMVYVCLHQHYSHART